MEAKKLVGSHQIRLRGTAILVARLLARKGVSLVLGFLPKKSYTLNMILSNVVSFDYEIDYENEYLKVIAYPTVSDLKEFDIAYGWDCYVEKPDGSKELVEMSNDFRKEVLDWIANDVAYAFLDFLRLLLTDEVRAYLKYNRIEEVEEFRSLKASNSKKYQEVLAS